MTRLLFSLLLPGTALLAGLASLSAKELDGVRAAATGPCPTVEEAIAKMTVPEGYGVRCFASEPMVINPVAMTWDHRGRLWVVELYEYPSGAAKPNAYSKTATDEAFRPVIPTEKDSPRDRVIILEDTDNDGKADKRTVFVEGLNLATAVLCGHGGVYIGQAPNMFFFRDTNGDDKADEYKTVLTGFGLEDRHELLNSMTWGPDGWMYFTHGVFTHSKVRRPEQKPEEGFILNAGVFRVKLQDQSVARPVPALSPEPAPGDTSVPPVTKDPASTPALPKAGTDLATVSGPVATDYEVYADGTSNPWGVDFDARGNAFVEACVIDHFFHMAPGGLYARQGGAPENPYAYELLPSIVPKDHPRHFRAAYAGIAIYQGGIYPADTHGHAFFGNIHDNAIHEEAMDPVGATFKARPIRDFLRANDGWFRPVSIQTGPDGFLWVMDWCDKYPCYQNALANPAGVDREKGRIWRICYKEGSTGVPPVSVNFPSRPEKDMDLSQLSPADLIQKLGTPNNWIRKAARQSLAERKHHQEILSAIASNGPSLELVWALMGTGHFTDRIHNASDTASLLSSNAPAIKQWAARIIGQTPGLRRRIILDPQAANIAGEVMIQQLLPLATDADAQVRLATATAVRQITAGKLTHGSDQFLNDVQDILQALIESSYGAEDKTLPFLIWQGIEPELALAPKQYLHWLATLAPDTKPLSLTLTNKAARRIIDTRKPENVDLLLTFFDQLKDHPDLTAAALEGMLKAQEAGALKPDKTDPSPYFTLWQQSPSDKVRTLAGRLGTLWGDPTAIAALMGTVLNAEADPGQRLEAIRTVRRLKSDAARASILDLLGTKTPDPITSEAIRAAGELGGLDLANKILASWESYSPALKNTAAEIFVSRQDWAARLLDAVEGKGTASIKINPAGIPVSVRRSFALNKDLKDRATQLLGAWNETGDDIKALIAAKRKAVIEGEPDMALGKVLYTATCATCHKFHGGGHEVGPELIGSGRSNLDAILANVIDPNQIIGNGYQNFLITTKDGRTLAGRIVEDTPTQVTLLGIGGSREVVPTADIATKEDTGLSLMPMGFGSLPDDQFRSLIWYILAPPEEGPLTREKKEALIKGAEAESPAVPVKTTATEYPRIDWESVSLWNPEWKVTAPEFEGTPRKLTDFGGRKNVLQLHPFPDKKSPSHLSRKLEVPSAGKPVLTFDAAAKDGHDWDLVIRINGKEVKRESINAKDGVWKSQSLDLTPWQGQTIEIQLENHPTGWSWEFSYWSELKSTP